MSSIITEEEISEYPYTLMLWKSKKGDGNETKRKENMHRSWRSSSRDRNSINNILFYIKKINGDSFGSKSTKAHGKRAATPE